MAVGTGIFLAALLIAPVFLYATTKDRWRWRTFVKRGVLAVLASIVVGGLVTGGVYVWNNLPIGLQKQYAGIDIGISPEELLYRRGNPTSVLGEAINDKGMEGFRAIIATDSIEKGKSIRDYDEWTYTEGNTNLYITFNKERTVVVSIKCYASAPSGRCPTIENINDGDTEASVIRRFGPPDNSKLSGVTKALYYSKIGVSFNLEKQHVYMLGISDPRWVEK